MVVRILNGRYKVKGVWILTEAFHSQGMGQKLVIALCKVRLARAVKSSCVSGRTGEAGHLINGNEHS